jgi:hypothetical protein
MITTRRARGIDISRHQGEFNPTLEKKKEIDYLILKASQKTWSDDKFEDFYSQTANFPIRGAYHFFTTINKESSKLLLKREVKKKIRDASPGTRTAVQNFNKRNNNGLPIMGPHEPRIALPNGSKLRVSATHKESDKDSGDGIIHGSGSRLYYKITNDQSNGKAKGLYVKKVDVEIAIVFSPIVNSANMYF